MRSSAGTVGLTEKRARVLTDLPLAAVRYAALLNTAVAGELPHERRMLRWVRHDVGVYEQLGFEYLPWLTQWPRQRALGQIADANKRLRELARQGYPADFGCADSTNQVLEHLRPALDTDVPYLVTFATLTRASDPGWRWHKAGPYLGTREPVREHLGDEPDIDQVVTFDLWQVRADVTHLTGRWRPELDEWLTNRMAGRRTPRPDLPARTLPRELPAHDDRTPG